MAPKVFVIIISFLLLGSAKIITVPEAKTSGGGPPTRAQRPSWQQQMNQARRIAAAGDIFSMVVQGKGVYVFYNNPRPFCYMYMIPGDWVMGKEPNAFRSKDGRAFAGVQFMLPSQLEGVEGATMIERAGTVLTRVHEKALGQPLSGVEMVPFKSAHPKTWRWRAPAVNQKGQSIFMQKFLLDLSPDAVVQITVAGTGDDDGLTKRIIETLRTTKDSECFFPVLESMLRAMLGDR